MTNHKKVAFLISQALPVSYLNRTGDPRYPEKTKRERLRENILAKSWDSFGIVLEWVSDKEFSWEIETNVDTFCTATLFSPPDNDNMLHEVIKDSTYGEMAARLSCIAGAIVAGELI